MNVLEFFNHKLHDTNTVEELLDLITEIGTLVAGGPNPAGIVHALRDLSDLASTTPHVPTPPVDHAA